MLKKTERILESGGPIADIPGDVSLDFPPHAIVGRRVMVAIGQGLPKGFAHRPRVFMACQSASVIWSPKKLNCPAPLSHSPPSIVTTSP